MILLQDSGAQRCPPPKERPPDIEPDDRPDDSPGLAKPLRVENVELGAKFEPVVPIALESGGGEVSGLGYKL